MSAQTESVLFSATTLLLVAVIFVGLTGFAFPTAASAPDQQVLHAYRDTSCPTTAEAPVVRTGTDERG